MLTFILICLSSAFAITAIHSQFNTPGSLIYWIPDYLDAFISTHKRWKFIAKPLYECMICMSSFWGSIMFVLGSLLFAPNFVHLFYVLYSIPVTAGILVLISFYTFMQEISGEEDLNETNRTRF